MTGPQLAHRRGSRCPGWLLAAALLLASLATSGFGPPRLVDGRYPPLRLGPDEVAALVRLRHPPTVTAASALVFDIDAGAVVYSRQPDAPLPPASTVKIMTALVVLQRAGLADHVTVSDSAAATGGSRMGLAAGEQLTVEELLHGLLMASGNDAAVALAEHVAGSEAAFVALMNDTARALGLAGTRFVNPHGLDRDGAVSTAGDLLVITRAALEQPVFAGIVATRAATVAGRSLLNTNELLGAYPGADGVKTGTTDAAGECLVASVSRQGHRLVAVILGSGDRYGDARALLDYAAESWLWGRSSLPDDALSWEIRPGGRPYRLHGTGADLFLPAWQQHLVQPVRRIDVTAPLTGTLPVGELEWSIGGEVLARVPLTVFQGP